MSLLSDIFNRHPLQNLNQAEMLAYFLHKEILRHRKDIAKARGDLMRLKKDWGVDIDEVKKRVKVGDWITP